MTPLQLCLGADLQSQQMYIRVKRKKTTIFLHVDATDTVLEIKQKLQELVEQVGGVTFSVQVCV